MEETVLKKDYDSLYIACARANTDLLLVKSQLAQARHLLRRAKHQEGKGNWSWELQDKANVFLHTKDSGSGKGD